MPWTAEQKKENRKKVTKTHLKQDAPQAKTCEASTQTETPILAHGSHVQVARPFASLCGLRGAPATVFTCSGWDKYTKTWRLVVARGRFKDMVLVNNVPEEALIAVKAEAGAGSDEVRTKTDPGRKGP